MDVHALGKPRMAGAGQEWFCRDCMVRRAVTSADQVTGSPTSKNTQNGVKHDDDVRSFGARLGEGDDGSLIGPPAL